MPFCRPCVARTKTGPTKGRREPTDREPPLGRRKARRRATGYREPASPRAVDSNRRANTGGCTTNQSDASDVFHGPIATGDPSMEPRIAATDCGPQFNVSLKASLVFKVVATEARHHAGKRRRRPPEPVAGTAGMSNRSSATSIAPRAIKNRGVSDGRCVRPDRRHRANSGSATETGDIPGNHRPSADDASTKSVPRRTRQETHVRVSVSTV
jgi:hypothetical protein